jgi:hypothetical protein
VNYFDRLIGIVKFEGKLKCRSQKLFSHMTKLLNWSDAQSDETDLVRHFSRSASRKVRGSDDLGQADSSMRLSPTNTESIVSDRHSPSLCNQMFFQS